MHKILLGLSALLLAGCQTLPYSIDRSKSAANADSRVRALVMHYTANDEARSLEKLTAKEYAVSSHYLVSDTPAPQTNKITVYQLAPENKRTWHAGKSAWQHWTTLNASSIGIEIVNPGYGPDQDHVPMMQRSWAPFQEQQMTTVGMLVKEIIKNHDIDPTRVVGHSDIAPGRKVDPGPLFPWERLYREFNVGAWPDAERVKYFMQQQAYDGNIGLLQQKLEQYGYPIIVTGHSDQQTQNVLSAFQMHFRPAKYDGVPDPETAAILDALLEKYRR